APRAPRAAARTGPGADARRGALAASHAPRRILAVDPDVDEDPEAEDDGHDQRGPGVEVDHDPAEPDVDGEEERPEERGDAVRESGESHRRERLPAPRRPPLKEPRPRWRRKRFTEPVALSSPEPVGFSL